MCVWFVPFNQSLANRPLKRGACTFNQAVRVMQSYTTHTKKTSLREQQQQKSRHREACVTTWRRTRRCSPRFHIPICMFFCVCLWVWALFAACICLLCVLHICYIIFGVYIYDCARLVWSRLKSIYRDYSTSIRTICCAPQLYSRARSLSG